MSKAEHPYAAIGHRIQDCRKELGRRRGRKVTQAEVAKAIGVAVSTVTAWEIGKQRPEGQNLTKLARFLSTTESYILEGDTEGERRGVLWHTYGAGKTRSSLLQLLAESGDRTDEESDQTLRELWKRLDAIDQREDLTPMQKEMRQERELAAYRTSIHDRETRNAADRLRVIDKEAELANNRTQAIDWPFEIIEPSARSEAARQRFYDELRTLVREELERQTAS